MIKNDIPPKEGLAEVFHRIRFSALLLVPRLPENLTKSPLIRIEKNRETIPNENKAINAYKTSEFNPDQVFNAQK